MCVTNGKDRPFPRTYKSNHLGYTHGPNPPMYENFSCLSWGIRLREESLRGPESSIIAHLRKIFRLLNGNISHIGFVYFDGRTLIIVGIHVSVRLPWFLIHLPKHTLSYLPKKSMTKVPVLVKWKVKKRPALEIKPFYIIQPPKFFQSSIIHWLVVNGRKHTRRRL